MSILERRWSEELPAVAPEHLGPLALGHRCESPLCAMLLLDEPARLGRRIEKQHAAGLRADALPRMRHAAWHEGAGAGPADRNLAGDQERDLAVQHIGDLVAVAVQMEPALGPGRSGLLEQHDAVRGIDAQQFHREEAARREVLD